LLFFFLHAEDFTFFKNLSYSKNLPFQKKMISKISLPRMVLKQAIKEIEKANDDNN
jgi:hypothetical protein